MPASKLNPGILSAGIFLLFLASARPASSQDYYISPNGNDGDSGTSTQHPWRSLLRAGLVRFKPGDRIYLRGAVTLTGSLTLNAEESGTPSNPIVIDSYGTGRANIHPGRSAGIVVRGLGGVEIRNVNLFGDGWFYNKACGIRFQNDLEGVSLEHIRIENVDVKGFGEAGIAVIGSDASLGYRDVLIQNCAARESGGAGIEIRGRGTSRHRDIRILKCLSSGNTGFPGAASGNGIVLGSTDGALIESCAASGNGSLCDASPGPAGILVHDSSKVLVQRNESNGNETAGNTGGDGFRLDRATSGCIFQYNHSHDNAGAGFYLGGEAPPLDAEAGILRFNISRNDAGKNRTAGILVKTTGSLVINNNVVSIARNAARPSAAISLLRYPAGPAVIVCNNVFLSDSGVPLAYLARLESAGKDRVLFQGNAYFSDGGPLAINWLGRRYETLAGWRKGSGQETVQGKPVGTDCDPGIPASDGKRAPAGLESYRLSGASPLAAAGINLRKLHGTGPGDLDFFGNPIPPDGPFSVGVFQASPPQDAPPR